MRITTGYEWHLRQIMATRGMFATSDLQPKLAEHGIHLSREQTYRLVTGKPQRLALDVLAALCHILDCGPQDLVEVTAVTTQVRKTGTSGGKVRELPSTRVTIRRPDGA